MYYKIVKSWKLEWFSANCYKVSCLDWPFFRYQCLNSRLGCSRYRNWPGSSCLSFWWIEQPLRMHVACFGLGHSSFPTNQAWDELSSSSWSPFMYRAGHKSYTKESREVWCKSIKEHEHVFYALSSGTKFYMLFSRAVKHCMYVSVKLVSQSKLFQMFWCTSFGPLCI